MAKTAETDFQQQMETLRNDAFADGYAAAMRTVHELASRSAPMGEATAAARGRGRSRGRGQSRTRKVSRTPRLIHRPRRTRTNARTANNGARAGRGTNSILVAGVLKSAAPRALRAAEIRKALQDKGKTMSFPSIGYSLRQLAARDAAKQVGRSKTWRHHEA